MMMIEAAGEGPATPGAGDETIIVAAAAKHPAAVAPPPPPPAPPPPPPPPPPAFLKPPEVSAPPSTRNSFDVSEGYLVPVTPRGPSVKRFFPSSAEKDEDDEGH